MSAAKKLMMAGGFDWAGVPVGTAIEGGYYAGKIAIGGAPHAIIVAPRSTQQLLYNWGNSNTSAYTFSRNDSLSNMNQLLANGIDNYPAAKVCHDLSVNGFSDWLLPAIDVLEVCYRALKPTAGANSTADGQNSNSIPATANYALYVPGQTIAAQFAAGGTEAFDTTRSYWASTQPVSYQDRAYYTSFADGSQPSVIKTNTNNMAVRAVRIVPI